MGRGVPRGGSRYPAASHHFSLLPCRNSLLGLKSGSTCSCRCPSPGQGQPHLEIQSPARPIIAWLRAAESRRRLNNRNRKGGHPPSGQQIPCLLERRQLTKHPLLFPGPTAGLQPLQEPWVVVICRATQESMQKAKGTTKPSSALLPGPTALLHPFLPLQP